MQPIGFKEILTIIIKIAFGYYTYVSKGMQGLLIYIAFSIVVIVIGNLMKRGSKEEEEKETGLLSILPYVVVSGISMITGGGVCTPSMCMI